MTLIIILSAIYFIFWGVTFLLIKTYIKNLISQIRSEIMSMALLAKDYLKR